MRNPISAIGRLPQRFVSMQAVVAWGLSLATQNEMLKATASRASEIRIPFSQVYVRDHHYVSTVTCVEPFACVSVSASLDGPRKAVDPTHLGDISPLELLVNIRQMFQAIRRAYRKILRVIS